MSILVSTILSTVRLRYGDLTDAAGLIYLQQTRSEVLARLRIREATITINTAVDTRKYALSAVMKSVDQVRYRRSSATDDYKTLTATSKEDLYAHYTEFGKADSGEPEYFALGSDSAGPTLSVYPPTDLATTGGYPILEIDGEQDEALSTSTTIYDDLPNERVYVTGVKWLFSEDNHPEDAPGFKAEYEEAIVKAQAYLQNKNRRKSTQFMPDYMRRRAGVR